MDIEKFTKFIKGSRFPLFFFAVLYLLLSSRNNMGDALMYAADIREGVDLFYPHHLLYNAFGWILSSMFGIKETLPFLCGLNALAAVFCLVLLRNIMRTVTGDEAKTTSWLWITGACWGVMHFATEGETYILPLVFSLAATCAFVRKRNPLRISFWAAVACLFHQIHFFWWLGLAMGVCLRKRKQIGMYLLGALIVPAVYLSVYRLVPNDSANVLYYMLHDYIYVDSVGFSWKQAFVLTPVNLFRTFVQVHGYIPSLLRHYPLLAAGPLSAAVFVILFLCKRARKKEDSSTEIKTEDRTENRQVFLTHGLILLLQLFFAFISNGNAEFMVMIPFSLAVCMVCQSRFPFGNLPYLAAALLSWNLMLGLIPYRFIELTPYKAIEKHMAAHPDKAYFIDDYAMMYNRLYYDCPELCDNLLKEPEKEVFYTDGYNKKFLSRASVTEVLSESNEHEVGSVLQRDTLNFDLGEWVLCLVQFENR